MTKREGLHDFLLRVPEDLWARFADLAEQERRTATQQLVWLIERWVNESGQQDAGRKGKQKK